MANKKKNIYFATCYYNDQTATLNGPLTRVKKELKAKGITGDAIEAAYWRAFVNGIPSAGVFSAAGNTPAEKVVYDALGREDDNEAAMILEAFLGVDLFRATEEDAYVFVPLTECIGKAQTAHAYAESRRDKKPKKTAAEAQEATEEDNAEFDRIMSRMRDMGEDDE